MFVKKTLPWMLLVFVLYSGTALAGRPAVPYGIRTSTPVSPLRVKAMEVFLRNCAGSSCNIIGTLKRGDRIQIKETVRAWIRVLNIDNGLEGWCKKSELNPRIFYKYARVKPAVLHFRSCGGMQCAILARLYKGQTMTILEHGRFWSKVRLHANKRVGWVATRYLYFYN